MDFYCDGWGSDKDADGEWFSGYDIENRAGRFSVPAEIFVRVRLRRDGRPMISWLADCLTHEWMHHWVAVHEGPIASPTFDNIHKKVRL